MFCNYVPHYVTQSVEVLWFVNFKIGQRRHEGSLLEAHRVRIVAYSKSHQLV